MAQDKEKMIKQMRAGKFRENNGRVMRTINILREMYVELKTLSYALPDLDKGEIIDCVNFLEEEGYIRIRHLETKQDALLSDNDFNSLEAKSTGKGIRLLAGSIIDDMVEM